MISVPSQIRHRTPHASGIFPREFGRSPDWPCLPGALSSDQKETRWVMTKYTGGETVKAGFYWNQAKLGAEIVPAEGGALPGTDETTYYRIAWPVLLVAAPVMGGAFAMVPPVIGV